MCPFGDWPRSAGLPPNAAHGQPCEQGKHGRLLFTLSSRTRCHHKGHNNKPSCSGVWLRWWVGHNPQSFHGLPRPPESTWRENTPAIAWDKLLNLSEFQFPLLGNEGKLESRTPNAQSSNLSGLNCLGSKSSSGVPLVLSWS